MSEQWRPVAWPTGYEVSDRGRVRSLKGAGPRILKPFTRHTGYLVVQLSGQGDERRGAYVHALVAEAFHGPRPAGRQIRHLDGNPANNTPGNLRYGTAKENSADLLRHGRHYWKNRTHCPKGHRYDETNTYIRPNGHRDCRVCIQESRAAYDDKWRGKKAPCPGCGAELSRTRLKVHRNMHRAEQEAS